MDELFYIIIMKTSKDKILYLMADKGNSCKWTFNKNDAIWFETTKQAENFCSDYFKNFSNYEIVAIKERI